MNAIPALAVLAVRTVLPGMLLARSGGGWVSRAGRAVFAGVAANLLLVAGLVSCGRWTVAADWALWAALVACAAGWRARRGKLAEALRGWWQPTLGVLALAGLAALMPVRSEWRMGGWDPGHYQNNAVCIAHSGSLEGPSGTVYETLSPEERETLAYLHYGGEYRALANNQPLDRENRQPLFFFHLTSIAGAVLYRLGGDAFLDRVGAFWCLGLLAPLVPLLGALGLRGWRRAVAAGFFFLSPLLWYHQAFPTAEMLYLFLLLGGMADWLESADADPPRLPWMAWTAAFLLVLNHLNSAVLVAGMAVYAAVFEAWVRRPRRTLRVAGAFAALALGFLWDALFAATTLAKLQDDESSLTVILAVFGLCAVLGIALTRARFPDWMAKAAGVAARLASWAGGGVLAAVAVAAQFGAARDWFYVLYEKVPLAGTALWWLMRQVPFYGLSVLLMASAGTVLLGCGREARTARLALCVMAFGGLFGLILVNPGIAKLFPWGLRRFFVYSVPFVALAQTVPVLWAAESWRRRRIPAAAVLAAALGVAAAEAKLAAQAARTGDYAGLAGVVRQIEDVLRPGDVVVTDSATWMTPLMVAGGRNAVNGEPLWKTAADRDPSDHSVGELPPRGRYLELVRSLPGRTGERLLWLTCTSKGVDIYPEPPAVVPEPLVSVDFPATTVRHGQRNKEYSTGTRNVTVRLFEDAGPAAAETNP